MKTKTAVRHHLMPVRMAIIKKTKNKKYQRKCRKKEPSLLVGVYIDAATMEEYSDYSKINRTIT